MYYVGLMSLYYLFRIFVILVYRYKKNLELMRNRAQIAMNEGLKNVLLAEIPLTLSAKAIKYL